MLQHLPSRRQELGTRLACLMTSSEPSLLGSENALTVQELRSCRLKNFHFSAKWRHLGRYPTGKPCWLNAVDLAFKKRSSSHGWSPRIRARRPALLPLVLLQACSNTLGSPCLLCGEITRFLLLQINTSQPEETAGSIVRRVYIPHLKSARCRKC